jgi:hypothetical protein
MHFDIIYHCMYSYVGDVFVTMARSICLSPDVAALC